MWSGYSFSERNERLPAIWERYAKWSCIETHEHMTGMHSIESGKRKE